MLARVKFMCILVYSVFALFQCCGLATEGHLACVIGRVTW